MQQDIAKHIQIISENKIPKDNKGNEFTTLEYTLDDRHTIDIFFEAMTKNTAFKGELIIHSTSELFDDSIGYRIGQLLENDCLKGFVVNNKDSPFSDRVTRYIGDTLYKSTNLQKFKVYLNVGELSYAHIMQFLLKPECSLKYLGFLKASKEFIETINKYKSFYIKESKLEHLEFYYEPFTQLNLLYKEFIPKEVYETFADIVINLRNIKKIEIIPWYELKSSEISQRLVKKHSVLSIPVLINTNCSPEEFEEYNMKLKEDIEIINLTLEFACKTAVERVSSKIEIDEDYAKEHDKMRRIM